MADGCHFEKLKNLFFLSQQRLDLTNQHEIWHGEAYWSSEPYPHLKFHSFENPRWWTRTILQNPKTAIFPQLFDRSAWNLAQWCMLTIWNVLIVKFQIFGNPRWHICRWSPSSKIELSYPSNCLTDQHEIWHSDVHWSFEPYWQLNIILSPSEHSVPLWCSLLSKFFFIYLCFHSTNGILLMAFLKFLYMELEC